MKLSSKSVAVFCAALAFGAGAALLTPTDAEARGGRRGGWGGGGHHRGGGGWGPGLAIGAGVVGLAAVIGANSAWGDDGYYPASTYSYYAYPPLPVGYYYSSPTVCVGRAPVYDGYGSYLGYKSVRVAC